MAPVVAAADLSSTSSRSTLLCPRAHLNGGDIGWNESWRSRANTVTHQFVAFLASQLGRVRVTMQRAL
jgi:hypothetical protein